MRAIASDSILVQSHRRQPAFKTSDIECTLHRPVKVGEALAKLHPVIAKVCVEHLIGSKRSFISHVKGLSTQSGDRSAMLCEGPDVRHQTAPDGSGLYNATYNLAT